MPDEQRTRPYHAGAAGAPSIAEAEIIFGPAAKRQLIATVPAGAVILSAWVEVLEAFNAGSSNLVTLGYGATGAGTADDYVATVTEGTPGVYGQAAPGVPFPALAAAQDVYIYYTPGGTAPGTGKARGFIHYARLADNG
jgi:precorrin-3B methylase